MLSDNDTSNVAQSDPIAHNSGVPIAVNGSGERAANMSDDDDDDDDEDDMPLVSSTQHATRCNKLRLKC